MAIVPLTSSIVDGSFDFPQEISGSPIISTDEITKSLLITRNYVVLASEYVPLPQGSLDPIYPLSYLVNEQGSGHQGPLYFFSRVYAQIPNSRTEQRLVTYTRPGKSGTTTSGVVVISWNQYAGGAPYTRQLLGTVQFSYWLNAVPTGPSLSKVTGIGGAPVDFTGELYQYNGNIVVGGVTQPSWTFVGFTNPSILPATWVIDVQASRWRGNIWEKQVVTVPTSI